MESKITRFRITVKVEEVQKDFTFKTPMSSAWTKEIESDLNPDVICQKILNKTR